MMPVDRVEQILMLITEEKFPDKDKFKELGRKKLEVFSLICDADKVSKIKLDNAFVVHICL